MKEDILEQLVDDYLQTQGYFTRHNIKFRPAPGSDGFVSKKDSNHSDIDVIGYNPKKTGSDRVWVVSCKSWQSGFDVKARLDGLEQEKVESGRVAWKRFRELMVPRWTDAFFDAVRDVTGEKSFTYVTAVTFIKGDRQKWEKYARFSKAMKGNPIRLLPLEEILKHLDKDESTTVAASAIGRTLQLMRAAKKGSSALAKVVKSQADAEDE